MNDEVNGNDAEPNRQGRLNPRLPILRDDYPLRNRLRENTSEANISYALSAIDEEPMSYAEATGGEDSKEWIRAMDEEFNALLKNKTWLYTDLPNNRKTIKCMWVFRKKYKQDGTLDRYKARLVAKGCSQRKGIDYSETFSPVVRLDSVRAILAIAAHLDLDIIQFDVKTAFLNGDITDEIYMDQPTGYENGNAVCLLKKCLYGLKQSPRAWNQKFTSFIKKYNLKASPADPCIFYYVTDTMKTFLAVYVDDGLLCCNDQAHMKEIIDDLGKYFEIKTLDPNVFVGLQIFRSRKLRVIHINQSNYIKKVLTKFGLENCKGSSTPSDTSIKLSKAMAGDKLTDAPNREAIGCLMFAMTGTRPDIAQAVGVVSRFANQPTSQHWEGVKRILRFLKASINHGISFSGRNKLELVGFCDSDYAGDLDNRRSTSGYVFLLGGGAITWKSQRQRSVALSTTEAEYVSASLAAREAVWLRSLLMSMGVISDEPTKIYCDNQSALRLIRNPEFHQRSKHIDIKHHYVRERQAEGTVEVSYISSEDQLADYLTKPLSAERFVRLSTACGVTEFEFTH